MQLHSQGPCFANRPNDVRDSEWCVVDCCIFVAALPYPSVLAFVKDEVLPKEWEDLRGDSAIGSPIWFSPSAVIFLRFVNDSKFI